MNMKDIQNSKDSRGIKIKEVGVTDLLIPIKLDFAINNERILSRLKMGANLLSDRKGTHMSRFVEIAESLKNSNVSSEVLFETVKKIKDNLESEYAKMEFDFTLFLEKKTPISQKVCSMNYECSMGCELSNNNTNFITKVQVPIATLCPCSKEISEFGAHNQRALVSFELRSNELVSPDVLIKVIEKIGSSELFPILKRIDEKYITEKMYRNPMFVEDIVRDVALWAKSNDKILDFKIGCKSYESIHNHNAYAIIINEEIKC
jgi:GTP cyclohydrolase I